MFSRIAETFIGQSHVRVCSGPHHGAKRGDVEIWISRTLAWSNDPLDKPPTADDVTLLAAGQGFLMINLKTFYICCDIVCVHLQSASYSGITGSIEEATLKQLATLREIDEALDVRKKWRPIVILGDFNTELGNFTSACNSDHQSPRLEGPIAHDLVVFFTKHSLCLPSTFQELHGGDRNTHYSLIFGYRRIDYVALLVGWHAATTTSFVDRTVDLLSPGETIFLLLPVFLAIFRAPPRSPRPRGG